MRLKDKVAFITGGGTGIGFAIAKRFHAEGASVGLMGRRREVLDQAVKSLGSGAMAVPGDATREADVANAVDRIKATFGALDIVIPAAGGQIKRTDLEETTLDIFRGTLELNVISAFLAAREGVRVMRDGGAIVFIGSNAGFIGRSGRFSYAAAKMALQGMTKQMAVTLARRNIRVNIVAPAIVPTDLTRPLIEKATPAQIEQMLDEMPIRRFGAVEDVANACLYLASDEATWVTGANLPVDGGFLAL
ncbi:MAG: glucose 1-dehydrogenase [Alphaproteobacteria bacterium]|nr:glucose 1-dehydrogenase [Alphaproteobacteria bacterium]